jgi:pyruvate carboxylase
MDTRSFLTGIKVREEVAVTLELGKQLVIRLVGQSELDKDGIVNLQFKMNGTPHTFSVEDKSAGANDAPKRPKALTGVQGSIGAPMPSVVLEPKVKKGNKVSVGLPLVRTHLSQNPLPSTSYSSVASTSLLTKQIIY